MSHALDAEVLDMLIEVTGDAARGVIALFLEECRDLNAVIAGLGADRTATGRAAHSRKSQGRVFGGSGVVRSRGPRTYCSSQPHLTRARQQRRRHSRAAIVMRPSNIELLSLLLIF